MAKKKETTGKRVYKRRRPIAADVEMALVEYIRHGFNSREAERATGIHHTRILRAWNSLTQEQQEEYRQRAIDIVDILNDKIMEAESTAIAEISLRLGDISKLALDEIEVRLKDPIRRTEMKDADLINIATKCITIVNDNMRLPADNKPPERVTNIFNILDQSIQEHLTVKSIRHGEE
jgi:hypothetical protein